MPKGYHNDLNREDHIKERIRNSVIGLICIF